jgi:hypothetical protein
LAYRNHEIVLLCGEKCAEVMESTFDVFGRGFDGLIRGVYDGVVYTRFATNMVLLITSESPYLAHARKRPLEQTSAPTVPFPGDKPMVILASDGRSCHDACADERVVCVEGLMPFLNRCEWLKKRFGCRRACSALDTLGGPGLSLDGGDFCFTTLVRRMSCDFQVTGKRMLCPCLSRHDFLSQLT